MPGIVDYHLGADADIVFDVRGQQCRLHRPRSLIAITGCFN